jgi:hypothetical protein
VVPPKVEYSLTAYREAIAAQGLVNALPTRAIDESAMDENDILCGRA